MSSSNLEILAYEATPLGPLCLRRRRLLNAPGTTVTETTLNHEFLMSSYYTDSERALASTAVQMHGGENLDILIGGLGLGYTAHEVLGFGCVRSVEVVEFLPQVITWFDRGLVPLAVELSSDERLRFFKGDIYRRLSGSPKKKFDVILIDVDHSPDDRLDFDSGRFYTAEGLKEVREHLAQGGVLGVWSCAEDSPFVDALHEMFCEVRIQPVSFNNGFIDNKQVTDWLFFAKK